MLSYRPKLLSQLGTCKTEVDWVCGRYLALSNCVGLRELWCRYTGVSLGRDPLQNSRPPPTDQPHCPPMEYWAW